MKGAVVISGGFGEIGDGLYGPLVGRGQADLIIALEPLEGLRIGVQYIKKHGIAILNDEMVPPVDVNTGTAKYPDLQEIKRALTELGGTVRIVGGTRLAVQAGTAKAR